MTQSISSSFLADVRRAAKRVRAHYAPSAGKDKGGTLATAIGKETAALLARCARGLGDLPREIALYWLNTAKLDECASNDGIPEEEMERLLAFHDFLAGGEVENLSKEDWEELAGMVNDASEELDVNTLTAMMSTLLDNGAL